MTAKPSRVAISGASSFTGLWIACAFSEKGWKVDSLLARPKEAYSGVRGVRVQLLFQGTSIHSGIRAEDGSMAEWIRKHQPEIWVHHHHFMEEYRSGAYDMPRSRQVGIEPLPEIVRALSESGCKGVIYSGSFFEPGEGAIVKTLEPTPYSKSKKEVWDALAAECAKHGLKLSKFVSPNPIGPLENEDRLIPLMIRNALRPPETQKPMELKTPRAVSDYLPGPTIGSVYVELAEELLSGKSRIARPSGLIAPVSEFTEIINRELIVKRLELKPCPIQIDPKRMQDAPSGFQNPIQEAVQVNWEEAWDQYARVLRETKALELLRNSS